MYYNNKLFLISYYHATCGHFIQTITELLLSDERNSPVEFPLNGTGLPIKCTWIRHQNYIRKKNNTENIDNWYNLIIPTDNENLCQAEHNKPNWNDLFTKFPYAKNIVITVSENSLLRLVANSYYKQKYKFITSLDEIDHKTSKTNIEEIVERRLKNKFIGNEIQSPYTDSFFVPEELKNKVFTIKLYDIIHNKETILNTLEIITSKKIFNSVSISYDNYLKRQKELIPWLDDK